MTASPKDDDREGLSETERAKFKKRISELDHKISDFRQEHQSDMPKKSGGMMSSVAFKMASEFIAGPIAGGLLGWWLDRVFETSPLFLLILFLLGLAAGFLNVMRSARLLQETQMRKEQKQQEQDNKNDHT